MQSWRQHQMNSREGRELREPSREKQLNQSPRPLPSTVWPEHGSHWTLLNALLVWGQLLEKEVETGPCPHPGLSQGHLLSGGRVPGGAESDRKPLPSSSPQAKWPTTHVSLTLSPFSKVLLSLRMGPVVPLLGFLSESMWTPPVLTDAMQNSRQWDGHQCLWNVCCSQKQHVQCDRALTHP